MENMLIRSMSVTGWMSLLLKIGSVGISRLVVPALCIELSNTLAWVELRMRAHHWTLHQFIRVVNQIWRNFHLLSRIRNSPHLLRHFMEIIWYHTPCAIEMRIVLAADLACRLCYRVMWIEVRRLLNPETFLDGILDMNRFALHR